MPHRSRSQREDRKGDKPKRVAMINVETQTTENDFCLCFVPKYTCANVENIEIDPRISADLNRVEWHTDEGRCFVRNFEVKPTFNAKKKWRKSGNAIRAAGKLRRNKNRYFDLTLSKPDCSDLSSGLYTREIISNELGLDHNDAEFSKKRGRFLGIFGRRKQKTSRRNMSFQDVIVDATNGGGKVFQKADAKTEENLIIESFINECMRETVSTKKGAHEWKNQRTQQQQKQEFSSQSGDASHNEERRKGRKTSRSTTFHSSSRDVTHECTTSPPRLAERSQSDLRDMKRRPKSQQQQQQRYGSRDEISNKLKYSDRGGEKRTTRSSLKLLNYLEKADENKPASSHRNSSRNEDNNSDHGSSYSAFAIVPGTELQRQLSQRGINDKASLTIIKGSIIPPPTKNRRDRRKIKSAIDLHQEQKREPFCSVDNIYSSSVISKSQSYRHPTNMTPKLQNSFSADDIVDNCTFKPLRQAKENQSTKSPMFAVTSTPRDELADENEEGYATYV